MSTPDRPIHRAVLPIAVALALATGIMLAETRLVVVAPVVTVGNAPQEDANSAVVRRFYAAVNDVVHTGDGAPIELVLAPDCVEHTPPPGATPDRDGLVRHLQSLHTIAPASQLTVIDLLAQDDRVSARVRLDAADAVFLGLPIRPDLLWGAVDVFRVRSGEIVEHWGDREGSALFTPLLSVSVPIAAPQRQVMALERWSFAASATRHDPTETGSLVLVVESGTLSLALDADSPASASLVQRETGGGSRLDRLVAPGEETALRAGDALVLPQRARYELASLDPAVALVLSLDPLPAGHGTATSGVDDVTPTAKPKLSTSHVARAVLAGGMAVDLPKGSLKIDLGRAVLASSAAFPSHQVAVAELVAVESGDLSLMVGDGAAWVMPDPSAGIRTSLATTLPTGGGALVPAVTAVTYQAPPADHPVAMLLIRVQPDR